MIRQPNYQKMNLQSDKPRSLEAVAEVSDEIYALVIKRQVIHRMYDYTIVLAASQALAIRPLKLKTSMVPASY